MKKDHKIIHNTIPFDNLPIGNNLLCEEVKRRQRALELTFPNFEERFEHQKKIWPVRVSETYIDSLLKKQSHKEFEEQYLCKPSKEQCEEYQKAFDAAVAYESNYRTKYEHPEGCYKYRKTPVRGETMYDFACRFGTTIKEMKKCEREVDNYLDNKHENK